MVNSEATIQPITMTASFYGLVTSQLWNITRVCCLVLFLIIFFCLFGFWSFIGLFLGFLLDFCLFVFYFVFCLFGGGERFGRYPVELGTASLRDYNASHSPMHVRCARFL